MEIEEIRTYIDSYKFDSAEEKTAFEIEIQLLLQEVAIQQIVRRNTLSILYNLYLSLCGEESVLLNVLVSSNPTANKGKLLQYLSNFTKQNLNLPSQTTAQEVFLHLCAKQIEDYYLDVILEKEILDFYPPPTLKIISQFPAERIYLLADIWVDYGSLFSEEDKLLLAELLEEIDEEAVNDLSPIHLNNFFQDILPVFVERFAHRIPQHLLFHHPIRIAAWYQVWRNHFLQLEEIEDQDYYALDFKTIIKYTPEFIWWNNGLRFQSGIKKFYFGSDGFIHLAKGGSIRDAPNTEPFTRRMAKAFVNLPFNFDQLGKNMYIYCYGEALGVGPQLHDMMQEFVRHPTANIQLQEELDKWNPVLQKMTCEEFETLTRAEAESLMGYLYHCLRDQPDFSVQRRSFDHILRGSHAYYERIEARNRRQRELARQRRRINEQRLAEYNLDRDQLNRRLAAEREKLFLAPKWSPHKTVKHFVKGTMRIIELTSRHALHSEGASMSHCVGSYAQRCIQGYCSIWSLRETQSQKEYSRVTIELDQSKRIVQASARFNAVPDAKYMNFIKLWSKKNNLRM